MTTAYAYDFRMRLTSIKTGTGGSPESAQRLTLGYDLASNITGGTNCLGDGQPCSASNAGEALAYTYDDLDWLKTMSINGTPSASYSYNTIGNMTAKQEATSNLTLQYPNAGQARPHAVTSTTGSEELSMAYDASGNLATQGSSTVCSNTAHVHRVRSVGAGRSDATSRPLGGNARVGSTPTFGTRALRFKAVASSRPAGSTDDPLAARRPRIAPASLRPAPAPPCPRA